MFVIGHTASFSRHSSLSVCTCPHNQSLSETPYRQRDLNFVKKCADIDIYILFRAYYDLCVFLSPLYVMYGGKRRQEEIFMVKHAMYGSIIELVVCSVNGSICYLPHLQFWKYNFSVPKGLYCSVQSLIGEHFHSIVLLLAMEPGVSTSIGRFYS